MENSAFIERIQNRPARLHTSMYEKLREIHMTGHGGKNNIMGHQLLLKRF